MKGDNSEPPHDLLFEVVQEAHASVRRQMAGLAMQVMECRAAATDAIVSAALTSDAKLQAAYEKIAQTYEQLAAISEAAYDQYVMRSEIGPGEHKLLRRTEVYLYPSQARHSASKSNEIIRPERTRKRRELYSMSSSA
jgi:hypothetical protein